jgi:hypothetical protein
MLLARSWALCGNPKGYYPYVADCQEEWQSVPAKLPPQLGVGTVAMWFYCESSRAYFPYAPYCDAGWQSVPAMPPPNPDTEVPQAVARK